MASGGAGPEGLAGGTSLIRFAEAAVAHDEAALAEARAAIVHELGPASLVDAAAVVGNFQRMVRIADGSGIPLDGPMAAITVDLREDLGLNGFASARGAGQSGVLGRALAKTLRPVAVFALRLLARSGRAAT